MQNGAGSEHMPAMGGQLRGPELPGLKRKHPDEGFGFSGSEPQGQNSPTLRNAPPVNDVFRMRRKQRTKMSDV